METLLTWVFLFCEILKVLLKFASQFMETINGTAFEEQSQIY